jgi:hypothetical protein
MQHDEGESMMRWLTILTTALTLMLLIPLKLFAQEAITDCERRCGLRTDMFGRTGPYYALADCMDRCSREFWKKVDQKDKDLEETR